MLITGLYILHIPIDKVYLCMLYTNADNNTGVDYNATDNDILIATNVYFADIIIVVFTL